MKNTILIAEILFAVFIASSCQKEFGVTGVSPAVGMISGGESIEIMGSGFSPDMGITVYFGGIKADNAVVSGSDTITVTTPSAPKVGTVDLQILTDSGQEFLLKNAFKYITYDDRTRMDIRDFGERRSLRKKQ